MLDPLKHIGNTAHPELGNIVATRHSIGYSTPITAVMYIYNPRVISINMRTIVFVLGQQSPPLQLGSMQRSIIIVASSTTHYTVTRHKQEAPIRTVHSTISNIAGKGLITAIAQGLKQVINIVALGLQAAALVWKGHHNSIQ